MTDQFSNFALSSLLTGVSTGSLTFVLQPGDGGKFPATGPFMVLAGSAVPGGLHELAKATARTGDVLTVTRQQESTSAVAWGANTTIQQVASAGNFANLWNAVNAGSGGISAYPVKSYGAVGNGVADDTSAIQSAITACQNGGAGQVLLTDGTFLISSTLVISADNVEIVGSGWGAQLIAASNFSGYMLQVLGPGGAGNFRYGIRMADFYLNGQSHPNVQGIDLVSTYGAQLDHVRCNYIQGGINVHWDGISNAFGAYNYMDDCFLANGGPTGIGIKTDNSEWLSINGGHVGYFSGSTAIAVELSNLNCEIRGMQFDHNDTSITCNFAGRATIVGNQFDRGMTHFIYLQGSRNNIVANNFFGVMSASGSDLIRADSSNNDKNVIIGNSVEISSGWTYFYNENSNIGGSNTVVNNDTGQLPIGLHTGIARQNAGYNPVGHLTTPTMPLSGVAYSNASGVDALVSIFGGTVNNIQLQNATTGLTSGQFTVPAATTITLTYTASPSWTWIGL